MAQNDANQTELVNLREILVIGPPAVFRKYENHFSKKFRLLKSWESPVPFEDFLCMHSQNTQVVLTSASGTSKQLNSALRLLPALRFIVTTSVGVDHIDLNEFCRRSILVAHAASIFSADVADLAVGLLIDVLRGKRVGIVGLGSIGQEVAMRLQAFGCKISYQSREKKPSVSYPFYADVCELASNSDVLFICCALNNQTHHLINKEVLLALGRQGVIVNVARGAIIDEKELVQFLLEGKITGAGLDVFEHEPNVPKELCELDNVVLSPHCAVFTEESFMDLYDLVVGNLEAFFSNKPLLSPVQFG